MLACCVWEFCIHFVCENFVLILYKTCCVREFVFPLFRPHWCRVLLAIPLPEKINCPNFTFQLFPLKKVKTLRCWTFKHFFKTFYDILKLLSLMAITWLIMAISPLCSNSRETRGTSGEDYIEKDRIFPKCTFQSCIFPN